MHTPPIALHNGDCLAYLRSLPDNSVDSVVTDPPYGLGTPPPIAEVMRAWCKGETFEVTGTGFMNKAWDAFVPQPETWRECLRVLKPGGHLLAFAGTRTQHLMAASIAFAGFEIRDMCAWLYGSGFPKAMDISKAIEKELGAEREVVGTQRAHTKMQGGNYAGQKIDKKGGVVDITAPATPEAQKWEGWKTALKPALEPITLARKPIAAKTVAANVLEYGTGALNVDGCRVGKREREQFTGERKGEYLYSPTNYEKSIIPLPEGRYPANLMHDGSEVVLDIFPKDAPTGGGRKGEGGKRCYRGIENNTYSQQKHNGIDGELHWDEKRQDWYTLSQSYDEGGSASRFFYHAKASPADRQLGLPQKASNPHPTVKPIALMEYLIRLVTPPNGTTLDPFMGSGTTGIAAKKQGFGFIGCELEADYFKIAETRINNTPHKAPELF